MRAQSLHNFSPDFCYIRRDFMFLSNKMYLPHFSSSVIIFERTNLSVSLTSLNTSYLKKNDRKRFGIKDSLINHIIFNYIHFYDLTVKCLTMFLLKCATEPPLHPLFQERATPITILTFLARD